MKYRVTISSFAYRVIDVEANSSEEAEEMIQERIEEDGDEFFVDIYPYEFGNYVVEGEAFAVDTEEEDG